ncbi:cytochrome c biogenesis protein CcsA [Flavobacteriaceae bacterium S0825]|uniref:cytochrome c biogenesis protein n=1 Tax=Gaetbulibacter sp. S0825 TaxID=2720084 RepID=UPI001430CA7F|nr:cytochrome c biogenesis protein CcsA [Gaetbulibacter sp. S0825]MCK0109413.1 cytochrome c biogenesis protein CcsA [Flavobacteriaceae bacterium S0825]NIX65047.1 cytochrome c biogenesis protein CcsA [Gaetbulibacter sp. S0825]
MLKKLSNILFSTRLTAFLFIAFAVAMIIGTFMDAGQETSPTPYSRTLIYNAWWFETIMALFTINFIGNIFRYRLLRKEKWATLTLHLAFIFIFIGAFITRYISFEGIMAIREGATENTFLSQKTYLTVYMDGDYVVDGKQQRRIQQYETDFSHRLSNKFARNTDYNGQPVTIELEEFIQSAEEDIIPDDSGENYLKMVEAGMGGSHNHFLKEGQVQSIHNVLFALNKPTDGAVNITHTDSTLTIESPYEGEYLTMATQAKGKLVKDSIQPLVLRSRYIIGNQTLVFPKPVVKGVFDVVKKSEILRNDEDGLVLKVTANNETQTVKLLGGKGTNNAFKQVTIGGLDFALKYGSKAIELPFSVKLNDFIAKRFPGTENSYSAYESKVTVLDEQEGDFDFHIYMNNILNHRGYRFFQASFDPDEKGTILSVNHDFWGTNITYFGYFLLYFGLMAILFAKHTRFDDLRRNLKKIKAKKSATIIALFLATTIGVNAQETHTEDDGHDHTQQTVTKAQIDSILKVNITPKEQADKLGRLVIQDFDGRMKPINTYASELLRKLTKYEDYESFDSNQVFLSMQESPFLWYNVPIIYLKLKKADTIRSIIGLDKEENYATLAHFFTERGTYKLGNYLQEAYSTQVQTAIQKEFVEADQRVNLLYATLNGETLKIFPIPEDDNNTWISSPDYREQKIQLKDSLYGNFINTGFKAYLYMLNEGKKTGDFAESDKLLAAIKKTQQKYGAEVMLSDKKINTEILYNKYDIFKNLFSWYMYAGTLMFILLIVQIFKDRSKGINTAVSVFKYIIVGLFLLHTAGLIVRWYLSGHAPWSDAYESMIYVAWATMLFGLIFGRKSDITFAATAFVTAMILMIAHWNWMDPSIGTLQPVLNSYWLMIHVAVIVGSYGPFTLGMILGVVSLLLMILTNKENKAKMSLNIKELTIVNEMALTVGLVMLTIGNFLGGMWANESWGRYWGWDPKETWALISIMVYAFVIHMRLVPGLRGRFGFNLASILAFSSIIFTYFGVNFYLAGLHSYQSGQQLDSVNTIVIVFAIVAILAFFAYKKYAKYYKK